MDKIGGERLHDAGRVRVITRQSRNLAISPCDQGANIPYLDGLNFKHSVFQTTAWIEILIRSSRKRTFDAVLHVVPFFQFIRQRVYCHLIRVAILFHVLSSIGAQDKRLHAYFFNS